MAKCCVCNDHERAHGDEFFCRACREAAEKRQREHGTEQPSAVPIGSVCHNHPSALAHWIASRIDRDVSRLYCDHCMKLERAALDAADWLIAGEPVICNCVTCTPPQAAS